ncbi:hypothetical protein [Streptomyces griseoflavus]|uniref:Uncharacterized protein n=1 Tax=Streptomyces griseoflavus Tu4000 TaxID=467200 RepID=D9XSL8_9ACTN|nr:hypothetical protein [Streptomyces griseoflavus]EFL39425.1 hypothetical protein SSRG_02229 [Streptomyces griseoflavus Tu4000]
MAEKNKRKKKKTKRRGIDRTVGRHHVRTGRLAGGALGHHGTGRFLAG